MRVLLRLGPLISMLHPNKNKQQSGSNSKGACFHEPAELSALSVHGLEGSAYGRIEPSRTCAFLAQTPLR
jgi:hypothetical protein